MAFLVRGSGVGRSKLGVCDVKLCCESSSKFRAGRRRLMMMMLMMLMLMRVSGIGTEVKEEEPKPRAWPEQFHSVLVINNTKTNELQVVDLWYDWINGRNLNLIQHQLGKLLYDVEWNNGTSYYYTLGDGDGNSECRTVLFDVGILRPNWLDGATYIGQRHIHGFLCNVWQKVDFIFYYEDVITHTPVHWLFHTGRAVDVMTFEVGAVLEDSKWQAPVYCFNKQKQMQMQMQMQEEEHQPTISLSASLQHPQLFLRDSMPLPRLYDPFSFSAF